MRRLLWFRRDLRVEDNPLLSLGGEVLPLFIFDTQILAPLQPEDRRVSFIFSQVMRLKKELRRRGLDLKIFFGDPLEIFASLVRLGFDEVAAGGDYDAYAKERDLKISHLIDFNYLHDTYIFRPKEVVKPDGTPYLVYTPFYNRAKKLFSPEQMHEYAVAEQQLFATSYEGITQLHSGGVNILPLQIASIGFNAASPDTTAPDEKLKRLAGHLNSYAHDRDYPALKATSDLSADLRFGTISIRAVLRFLAGQKKQGIETEPFFRQLLFRDFYACLLYHFPHLATENFRYPFKGVEENAAYDAFIQAKTGVPIVDAGIRELLETGKMHNRVRMVCASFFTKELLLPWQWGEAFFARHLLDYDAASNILSWQWSAGTGVDPQPYFRIFNPYLQAKTFDKEARYIKRWLPELADVEARLLHDEHFLRTNTLAGYPQPIVERQKAVQRAKAYFDRALGKGDEPTDHGYELRLYLL